MFKNALKPSDGFKSYGSKGIYLFVHYVTRFAAVQHSECHGNRNSWVELLDLKMVALLPSSSSVCSGMIPKWLVLKRKFFYGCQPKNRGILLPKMDGIFSWKTLWKWMIWFGGTTIFGNTHIWECRNCENPSYICIVGIHSLVRWDLHLSDVSCSSKKNT